MQWSISLGILFEQDKAKGFHGLISLVISYKITINYQGNTTTL